MTDVNVLLHTGTHTGFWGAVEVALAIAALAATHAPFVRSPPTE